MATATFDTLKFANTLKAAGMSAPLAEAQATAFGEALQVNLRDLVTKDDLKAAVDGLRAESKVLGDSLRQETKALGDGLRLEIKNLADTLRLEMKNQTDALRAEMAAIRADMKNIADAIRAESKNTADAIRHESKEADQRLRSEQVLIRWIVGVVLFSMAGIVVRYFALRGVP